MSGATLKAKIKVTEVEESDEDDSDDNEANPKNATPGGPGTLYGLGDTQKSNPNGALINPADAGKDEDEDKELAML